MSPWSPAARVSRRIQSLPHANARFVVLCWCLQNRFSGAAKNESSIVMWACQNTGPTNSFRPCALINICVRFIVASSKFANAQPLGGATLRLGVRGCQSSIGVCATRSSTLHTNRHRTSDADRPVRIQNHTKDTLVRIPYPFEDQSTNRDSRFRGMARLESPQGRTGRRKAYRCSSFKPLNFATIRAFGYNVQPSAHIRWRPVGHARASA